MQEGPDAEQELQMRGVVMMIGRIPGATRVIGKSQGYLGLPVRDEVINEAVTGPATPCMVTAWLPTPKEMEVLNAGGAVHVRLIGIAHPPIMVEVGEPPINSIEDMLFTTRTDLDGPLDEIRGKFPEDGSK
jgi:hypothetical protein